MNLLQVILEKICNNIAVVLRYGQNRDSGRLDVGLKSTLCQQRQARGAGGHRHHTVCFMIVLSMYT